MSQAPLHNELESIVGTTVGGHYQVQSLLRRGGMGAIYLAEQHPLGRKSALKVLLRSWADDEVSVKRFELETSAIAQLNHPNIVTLYDYGRTEDGHMFIAMEYLEGKNLREILSEQTKIEPARAIGIVESVASGLAEAHRHGIVHRDLKPANLILVEGYDNDFVKILDFGLARSIDDTRSLTQQDVVPGTPNYIAPERVNGTDNDVRSDLYSLGALWFELVTGRLPFEAATSIKIIVKHLQETPPHPNTCGANVSDAMAKLILRLLAKNPDERPENAEALVRELKEMQSPWPLKRMPMPSASKTLDIGAFENQAAKTKPELEVPALDFGNALGLDTGEKPIALTQRKGGAQASLVPLDTSEAAVFLLTNIKQAAPQDTTPIASIAEASSMLGMAKTPLEVARVMVRYLQTRFDRSLILDARKSPPEVLHSGGAIFDTSLFEKASFEDPSKPDASFIWKWVEKGETYYGPSMKGNQWTSFYVSLAGHVPGGMLLAALQRQSKPAFMIYADHDKETLYANLKDVATLMREAAAALTLLSF